MTYLLDVSTLVAFLWETHEFNDRAVRWMKGKKLATCPITELGFVRVSVNGYGADLPNAREMLRSFLETYKPQFIPCDISALSGEQPASVSKTTDFYIANLAEKHGLKFATLDERIEHKSAFVIPA